MRLRSLVLFLIPLLGGYGAHCFQTHTDAVRWAADDVNRRVFVPSPEATKVAAMGWGMMTADLLWVRAVLLFVDFLDAEDEEDAVWTRTVIKTVGVLDPHWRTPFFYGGGMLRLLDDLEGSDEIFSDGMKAFPEDPYFPFSLAMNAYLFHQDLERAVKYLDRASKMENAPRWYRSASAEFLSRSGQRKTALKYLKDQIALANSDRERLVLENKYRSLLYEQVTDVIDGRQVRWEAHHGQKLESASQLPELPPDPLGGEWFVNPDGQVRSSAHELVVARRARNSARALLVNP
jgi:hypothetical protein